MASMTWVATCGNGARTLTIKIIITLPHPGTPLVPPPLSIRYCAGAVGAAIAASSAPPTAIMTWPPTATWRSDFAASDRRGHRQTRGPRDRRGLGPLGNIAVG